MWFTKSAEGFRGWFQIDKNGSLVTGLVSGVFTVTVVDPSDTTSTTPTVSESSVKPGLYTFLIPSSFFVANGLGEYGVVIEVDSTGPKVKATSSEVLRIFEHTFDDLTVPFDPMTLFSGTELSIADRVWDEFMNEHQGSGTAGKFLTNASNSSGTDIALGIANSVWSRQLPDVFITNSAGERLASTDDTVGTNLDATVSSRATQTSVDSLIEGQSAVSTTAAAGSSTTEIRTPLTQADAFFNGMFVLVVNSAGTVVRKIDEYQNTNGAILVDDPLPFTPAVSDTVVILTFHSSRYGGL